MLAAGCLRFVLLIFFLLMAAFFGLSILGSGIMLRY
jgi:hypothetical protein